MTNTISNVPRELKPCPFCGSKKISYSTHQIGIAVGCDSCGAVCEIKGSKEQCAEAWNTRAPSPAGVDGLNTDRNAAFKACPESGCDWGSFYLGWKARGEVEQAIIDGLRGEVGAQRVKTCAALKERNDAREERDAALVECGCTDGRSHSPECESEHAAAIAGGAFVQQPTGATLDAMRRNGLSIDGDNAYKRDLLDCVTGALAFGKQRSAPPPIGHWLERFYEIGQAEADERDQQAHRIAELASHLEFAVTMLTVAGLAGNAQVEAMRAALSAGVGRVK